LNKATNRALIPNYQFPRLRQGYGGQAIPNKNPNVQFSKLEIKSLNILLEIRN